jgi:hypothetical protein
MKVCFMGLVAAPLNTIVDIMVGVDLRTQDLILRLDQVQSIASLVTGIE